MFESLGSTMNGTVLRSVEAHKEISMLKIDHKEMANLEDMTLLIPASHGDENSGYTC